MNRTLLAAFIATTALAGSAAHAQSASREPSYDDGERRDPGGYYDSTSSSDGHWVTPAPYAREDMVDEGSPNDAAHRRDRARTAELNHNAASRPSSYAGTTYAQQQAEYRAELAQHDRDMQDYRRQRAIYAQRIAQWRARANACEAGNIEACDGPE